MKIISGIAAAVLAVTPVAAGIDLDVTDPASIKTAVASIAYDMMSYYTGNKTGGSLIGCLPAPYYWWEAGAMWAAMVEYTHLTGDQSYVKTVSEAILSQASPTNDFMMIDTQLYDLGNDDQAFWGLTAMSAAERNFPYAKEGVAKDEWFQLARNTFDDLAGRWNTTYCKGGLKWQWYPRNSGFDYKSTITNAAFFQLGARLARYTGNQTYVDWANKAWDWMTAIGFVDTSNYNVYDGAGDQHECTEIDKSMWSYNTAAALYGAAMMANISAPTTGAAGGSETWANRTQAVLDAAQRNFFGPPNTNAAKGVMYERQCELQGKCNTDQFSFKAYLSRWMAGTAVMQPQLGPQISLLHLASAEAAAAACSGGSNGRTCGTRWYTGAYDGVRGLGQQMSALECIGNLLVGRVDPPARAAAPNATTAAPQAVQKNSRHVEIVAEMAKIIEENE